METAFPLGYGDNPFLVASGKTAAGYAVLLPAPRLRHIRELGIYVVFGAGCTAGQVLLEAAHDPNYGGTWATLATINWAAASKVHHAAVTGLHLALRLRISTTIDNGTADFYALGN